MAKQQRLEIEAINRRKELEIQNDYQRGTDEYNEEHKDALATGDPLGKGTGMSLGTSPAPGSTDSKAINYSNINTKEGGGQYDIEGRDGVGGGRDRLMNMNLYKGENEYGPNSVDTSENVKLGQYVIK